MSTQTPWLAKLAAWTHDPAEKALVLMRDPLGHEGGTVRDLRRKLFPGGLPDKIKAAVRQADHWAAAADRPQFGAGGRDSWAQVRFDQEPVLIHPLSGEEFDLRALEIDPEHIKALSGIHFDELIVTDDARRTALNFWRFGPELGQSTLPMLWQLLPADTRIPDHTIWSHLDLTSAFTTAFTSDEKGEAALLAMSFGPVQQFIAAARTSSDLWAGSHLLSRLAWEGLKVIAGEIGPDAVIFPQLRGVPQVDLWLRDEIGLPAERFAGAEWATQKTDANPLFMAALPNKFVAIVPAGEARALAERVTGAVRAWVKTTAQAMLDELIEKAALANDPALPCHAQLAEQLSGFPEVHWTTVPFSLITSDANGKALAEQTRLASASLPFLGDVKRSGFIGSPVWSVLSKSIDIQGARFFTPNPGVLYPAVYDLLDRVAAAAKGVRPFAQTRQEGFRCDLTGEAEWLTTDRQQLALAKGQRKNTLWTRVAERSPQLLRKGEHLSAIALLKRLWPQTFVRELRSLDIDVQRYVISTHSMALAASLERWIERGGLAEVDTHKFSELLGQAATAPRSALPRRLIKKIQQPGACSEATRLLATRLPGLLDQDDLGEEGASALNRDIEKLLGSKPEAYYAFILLDGDKMGAWLSGTEPDYKLPYAATWHPKIRTIAQSRFPALKDYLNSPRAVSPALHMAISAALNDFALHLARHVVEDLCKGKLLYAGGDDVMAMVAVDDLLRCLLLLRLAYSGSWPEGSALHELLGLDGERGMAQFKRGHARLGGKLYRLMGDKATASAGAVVAHHQTPLARVLRELRASEKRAKTQGGRDAFSINLLKRSGGAVHLTLPWLTPGVEWRAALQGDMGNSPMALLVKLQALFAGATSRRAAYITQGWLDDLPTTEHIAPEQLQTLLGTNLAQQLMRQGDKTSAPLGHQLAEMACRIAARTPAQASAPASSSRKPEAELIRDILAVAEFLARESRLPKGDQA